MHIILLLVSLLASVSLFAQDIHFQNIGVENGISQPTVNSIYQDEFGIMWIGTKDGLNRYNGTDFDIFRPVENDRNSLYNNNVGTICGDRAGHIYIRCKYAVVEYDLRKEVFRTLRKNGVQAICYGRDRLWVATRDSLFAYDRERDMLVPYHTIPNTKEVCMMESGSGTLYVGTSGHGLFAIDRNKKYLNFLPGKSITCMYEDSKSNIWVGTKYDGLFRLDKNGGETAYKHLQNEGGGISNNYVRCIAEDNFGKYWIGTFNGLDRLDVETGVITNYSEDNKPYSLSNSSVLCITKDRQGTFWIGTYYGGINLFNPEYEIYTYYYADESAPGSLSSPYAGRMTEDSSGGIWVGTEGGGLNYLDRKSRTFKVYKHERNRNSLSSNTVQALYLDGDNRCLWIGTLFGGLDRLDLATGRFTNYRHDPHRKGSLINDVVRKIVPYQDKFLLATHNGIGLFDPRSGLCTDMLGDDRLRNRQILDMLLDRAGNIWFSYSLGLVKYNPQTRQMDEFFVPNSSERVVGSNLMHVLYEDQDGNVWVGSSGDGLFRYEAESNTFKSYNSHNSGLISDYILDIKESASGYLLIASNQGLSRFDSQNGYFYNYNKQNGFPMTALNVYGLFVASDNEIFLSGPKMMISFLENELSSYAKPYQLNFTSLKVNNTVVKPGDGSKIISESMLYRPTVNLNYNHSVVTINFSLSSYVSVLRNKIYYKLEGFDQDWIELDYRKGITYTNLNPGKYKLIVKSSEENSEKEAVLREVDIVVSPPFYKTSWAYFIYIVFIVASVWLAVNFYSSRLKWSAQLEYEKKEKRQIEEMNQSKLRFFTNISHEFRTPLTLIVSQLDMLMEQGDIHPFVYGKLVNIHRNTKRMMRLITELLDFRKQEQGYGQFKYSKQDIYQFLNEIYLSFKEYARARNITFKFYDNNRQTDLWFDVVQLEKVVYNLLSNAFKYTPAKGCVSLSVQEYDDCVEIVVADTGIGIPTTHQEKIFDRFYQVDVSDDQKGTGIGLALAKSIIMAHKGEIRVHSSEGEGTTFVVKLLLGDAHIDDAQKVVTPDIDSSCISELTLNGDRIMDEVAAEDHTLGEEPSEERNRILIVEDNDELRALLVRLFSKAYTVFEARDGEDGFEKTKELQPNIVLSDIMMPRMSGIEMCRKIKQYFDTSHIPVILLTAQTAEEYTVQGLKMGADDYVTKPFNVRRLFMRCNNLVNGRKLLQEKYARQPENSVDILATNGEDLEFMENCVSYIEQNLDNPSFDVAALAKYLAVGRTTLYQKLKGITGLTPNEFVINVRLKRAQVLLRQSGSKSIADIAYDMGFSSASYFIKCFKKQFGITPAQYKKEIKSV